MYFLFTCGVYSTYVFLIHTTDISIPFSHVLFTLFCFYTVLCLVFESYLSLAYAPGTPSFQIKTQSSPWHTLPVLLISFV